MYFLPILSHFHTSLRSFFAYFLNYLYKMTYTSLTQILRSTNKKYLINNRRKNFRKSSLNYQGIMRASLTNYFVSVFE